MKHSEGNMAKIGMVNFITAAPICETWRNTVFHTSWKLVEGNPVQLDEQLIDGRLDLGLVSSHGYGLYPDKFRILSGLSISTTSSANSVGPVFLFSHVPLDQLDQAVVFLSSQSQTSVSLVKIILEEFSGVQPVYTTGDVTTVAVDDYRAVLAIGDEALRMVAKSTYLYQFDLADIWKRETGLPFVFAVCTVREEFCQQNHEMLDDIHRELLRCRDEGVDGLKEICDIAAPRIPMPVTSCYSYLQSMEYDFSEQKQKALATFFDLLVKRGEIDENNLPLKIYSNIV